MMRGGELGEDVLNCNDPSAILNRVGRLAFEMLTTVTALQESIDNLTTAMRADEESLRRMIHELQRSPDARDGAEAERPGASGPRGALSPLECSVLAMSQARGGQWQQVCSLVDSADALVGSTLRLLTVSARQGPPLHEC